MRKAYYMILCWIGTMRAWMHWRSCNVPYHKTFVLCELVNLREALHLIDAGFVPVEVDYHSNGEHDNFYFRRTSALLMALADYRQVIRQAVLSVDYDDLTRVCDVPGSTISPIDDTALDNTIAPRGNMREAFTYEGWPVAMRQAYIEADTDTRRRMVNTAYQRG